MHRSRQGSPYCSRLKISLLLIIALFNGVALLAMNTSAAEVTPQLAFFRADELSNIKLQLLHGKAPQPTQQAYQLLINAADRALKQPDMSVTDKGITPPSGSKNDYLSLSAYWWPDTHKPDGLPWVRRDGKINPASKNEQSDGVRFASFTSKVQNLTLAWYFSGQQRYADKAASMLHRWFVDPKTKMNPNLNFAQGVPGISAGRNSGVLDGRYFSTRIVDSLSLLRGNPAWSQKDDNAVRKWMQDYLDWLLSNPIALKESRALNNHGNWYATQVAGIAWYLHRAEIIDHMVALTESKLETQLKTDGSQPLELARTRSFHYSYFNLQAVTLLAKLAAKNHQNLWNYKTANGSSIIRALDYLAPYADNRKMWPYKSLDKVGERLIPLMSWADNALQQPRYRQEVMDTSFDLAADEEDKNGKTRGAVIEALQETWLFSQPYETGR
ncbi:alginate lyase family protein [Rouxiella sp. T17]|uniref:alginate lyase family protein n=1 Tax=Rouxiella sp. T17 TaxID=3085684 RepID=UPI002FC926E2